MEKLKDLDDLNAAITVVRKQLRIKKLVVEQHYHFAVRLYWTPGGPYHLDAGVLVAILSKEIFKLGLDLEGQEISCGLHQDEEQAGIEIEVLDMKESESC